MTAYMVGDVDWHDDESLAKYVEGHAELLARYGGEILAATGDVEVIEGNWRPRVAVIFKFPSRKDFHAWYRSAEYAPRLALRRKHADTNMVVFGDP